MKSFLNLGITSKSLALPADEIVELHAARLLLLIKICGIKGSKIQGLTKLAKMDFFIRYPSFFKEVAEHLGKPVDINYETIESRMIRHHYGPWDKRYYQVLGYLEARKLITVIKVKNTFEFELTEIGQLKAAKLKKEKSFKSIIGQMTIVKKIVGRKSGSSLKNLIYDIFEKEIKNRKLGETI